MKRQIVGQRVKLRQLEGTDLRTIFMQIRDPEIRRNTLIPFPYTEEHAMQFITRSRTAWDDGTYYNFAVELRETGRLIGGLGFGAISKTHRKAEMGYWLGKKYRGQGLMTEAIELALRFGFGELKLNRIYAHVFTHNEGSARLLEKCGFTREGVIRSAIKSRGRYHDEILYGILKKEWGL